MTGRLVRFIRHRGSVRARLMVWNVCILALLLAVLGTIVQYSVQTVLLASVNRDLAQRATGGPRPFHHGPPGGPARFDHGGPPSLLAAGQQGPPQPGAPPPNPSPAGHDNGGLPSTPAGNPSFPPHPGAPPPDHFPAGHDMQTASTDPYAPRMLGSDGKNLFPQGPDPWDRRAFRQAIQGNEVYSTVTVNNEQVRVLSEPRRWRGKVVAVDQIPHPLTDTNQAIAGMKLTLLALIPVALLLAGVGGAAVTGRALRPVGQIAQTADKIGAHDLTQRLPVTGNDEFSHLATTFNNMLGRLGSAFASEQSLVRQLEASLEQQKRFTADASHELKTPLAVAKVHTSLLLQSQPTRAEYRESVQDIDHAVDTMSRLVQDLLLLAQNDAGQLGRRATDLFVRDILVEARRNACVHGGPPIRIESTDPTLTVFGNEMDMIRVFSNLFENASRHTPEDGEIRATVCPLDSAVLIRVSDTGVGIEPEHLAHLCERFYRVDAARSRPHGGAGLGLAICKSIVEQYGGSITFESTVGKGTTVCVTLLRRSRQETTVPETAHDSPDPERHVP